MEGASEIQQQLTHLRQELATAREERSRALEDAEKMKKTTASHLKGRQTRALIEFHESEAKRAKESERKMLDSLASQTKQLAEAKISLEESKLEIASLRESIKILSLDEELARLKKELRLALQAEEQGREAMDVLALALIEVSGESSRAKDQQRSTETALSLAEERLREAVEESQRLKQEAEEQLASWHEKEAGFINCVKAAESETRETREESRRFVKSNRASREEISKLRDLLKQAVNDAVAVKEALENARAENRRIKDLLQEKDGALNGLKQENESLRVSEAAATGSVRELKALVAATSSTEQWKTTEKAVAVRIRRQSSWGEVEGCGGMEGGEGDKEGEGVGFESRRLKVEDGRFEWSKQKKKKQFLRSFSDILRRKNCQR